jgi:hypothetical protein
MSSPSATDPDRSAFLVERYLPPAAADALAASIARVALLCAETSRSDLGVQYLQSAYLPSEDTCFCLFRGPSHDAVRQVNSEANFALDRITNAVLLLSTGSHTPDQPFRTTCRTETSP